MVGGACPSLAPAASVWGRVLPSQLLEGDNNVLEVVEGEVDVLGLSQDTAVCSGLGHSL